MARIRILQSIAGLDFSWVVGDVVEVDDEAAAGWADGERAEAAPDDAPVTVAAPSTVEAEDDGADKPFDPTAAKVDEVLAFLSTADEDEALRVLDAEAAAKKPRASVLKERDAILAAARERAAEAAGGTEQQAAEKAADTSRGGGRAEDPETRTE
ncbi:hypothetical protein V2W30_22655 [Streptomyces sp. Q6]|uniref:Uncharacterized protein n=1 Tax=Streptomyces citrinus TaxID=3118173 RepID=A0ACD5AFN6_9ACTN